MGRTQAAVAIPGRRRDSAILRAMTRHHFGSLIAAVVMTASCGSDDWYGSGEGTTVEGEAQEASGRGGAFEREPEGAERVALTRPAGAILADHAAADAFGSIPRDALDRAREGFRIFYGHTSHGSQIVTGLGMLARGDRHLRVNVGPGSLTLSESEGDLGTRGDSLWAEATQIVLRRRRSPYNVVMWSWCGGMSENTDEGIQTYLARMSALEREFPRVIFVYMTGHTDGSGPEGQLNRGNDQIREYCRDNGKVLFDFADLETWDPDGVEHPDASDGCAWCAAWCRANPDQCPDCDECAHSHCLNCLRKGEAFWWLLARLAGWSGR